MSTPPEAAPSAAAVGDVSGRTSGAMKHLRSLALLVSLFTLLACGPRSRSSESFDAIRAKVRSKNASEVEALLGKPDSRVRFLLGDERWIWWRYTYLDGPDYAPEVRGRVVHLSITFLNPSPQSQAPRPYSEWVIVEPLGIGYLLPEARR